MQINKLLIPTTTYMHTYIKGHPFANASNDPVEVTRAAEIITRVIQPAAFCTTVTFACSEQIIVLNIGYGHSVSFVCHLQSADSTSEEMFRYECVSKDMREAIECKIVEAICKMITHPAVYAQHKELIYNFVKPFS